MAMSLGADAVWVGTRFVASEEAGANKSHKEHVLKATMDSTIRTLIYSGRPLRVYRSDTVNRWEADQEKIKELTSKGIIPIQQEREQRGSRGEEGYLMGQCAG